MDDSQIRGDSVEAATSIALNKGTPPDYGVPAPSVATSSLACYLCGQYFDSTKRVNWRGHWICPGCYNSRTGIASVLGPSGPSGGAGPKGPCYRLNTVTQKLCASELGHSGCCDFTVDLFGPYGIKPPQEQVDWILHPTVFTKGPDTSAHAILEEAASTITQRGKDYNKDGGERSMVATVDAFNRITGHKLSVLHGWQFMVLLKMVRIQQSPGKRDSHTDCAAYAALAGEEALNKQNP